MYKVFYQKLRIYKTKAKLDSFKKIKKYVKLLYKG